VIKFIYINQAALDNAETGIWYIKQISVRAKIWIL